MTFLYIVGAAVLDIVANLFLQKSDGFKKKRFGFSALVLICVAFTLLAQASKAMDLTVAYVSWGALAILGTSFGARIFLGHRLNILGWLGMATILASIVVLETA